MITVGAMNTVGKSARTDDKITSYSWKGPNLFDLVVKPDLLAPGNRILSLEGPGSTLVNSYQSNQVPLYIYQANSANGSPSYFQLSGTSTAAPMVSGAATVLLQKNPGLSPDQVKAILMKTVSKFPETTSTATDPTTGIQFVSQYDIFTVGAGYLNLNAALANSDPFSGTAASPVAVYDPQTGNVYLPNANGAVWGTTVMGQSRGVVWGTGSGVASEAAGIAINGEN